MEKKKAGWFSGEMLWFLFSPVILAVIIGLELTYVPAAVRTNNPLDLALLCLGLPVAMVMITRGMGRSLPGFEPLVERTVKWIVPGVAVLCLWVLEGIGYARSVPLVPSTFAPLAEFFQRASISWWLFSLLVVLGMLVMLIASIHGKQPLGAFFAVVVLLFAVGYRISYFERDDLRLSVHEYTGTFTVEQLERITAGMNPVTVTVMASKDVTPVPYVRAKRDDRVITLFVKDAERFFFQPGSVNTDIRVLPPAEKERRIFGWFKHPCGLESGEWARLMNIPPDHFPLNPRDWGSRPLNAIALQIGGGRYVPVNNDRDMQLFPVLNDGEIAFSFNTPLEADNETNDRCSGAVTFKVWVIPYDLFQQRKSAG